MADTAWQLFMDRIAWQGNVHVGCRVLEATLDPDEMARLQGLGTSILTTLAMLGEHHGSDPSEDDEATVKALARVDTKLDVLLELFNRHLLQHVELPPRRIVRLNAEGILIEGWQAPAPGTPVAVSVHFDACVGLPLELPGCVEAGGDGGGGFVACNELAESLREAIEHLIFRQHRRQLAEARNDAAPAAE